MIPLPGGLSAALISGHAGVLYFLGNKAASE
jgi:hypothetical protein